MLYIKREGLKEGRKEGIEQEREQGIKTTAIEMIKEGIPEDKICRILKIDLNKLSEIKKN